MRSLLGAMPIVLAVSIACGEDPDQVQQRTLGAPAASEAAADPNVLDSKSENAGEAPTDTQPPEACTDPKTYFDQSVAALLEPCLACHRPNGVYASQNKSLFILGSPEQIWQSVQNAARAVEPLNNESLLRARARGVNHPGTAFAVDSPAYKNISYLVGLLTGADACTSQTETNVVVPPEVAPQFNFTCNTGSLEAAKSARLSRLEHRNSVNSLFSSYGISLSGDTILENLYDAVPADLTADGKTNTDLVLDRHVNGFFDVAYHLAKKVSASATLTTSLVGSCHQTCTDCNACVTTFIRGFGKRALRRPVAEPTELQSFLGYYNNTPLAKADKLTVLIAAILQQPDFLYRVIEGDSEAPGSNVRNLKPHEIASEMSYMLTSSPPDAALTAAADNGSLRDAAVRRAQAERLLQLPAARDTTRRFVDEWLHVSKPVQFNYSTHFLDGVDVNGLADAMKAELFAYADHVIWNRSGGYRELLTADYSFVRHPGLARIYDIALPTTADGYVTFADGRRRGLLSKAALLASGMDGSSPVHRGHIVGMNMLCESAPPPPPDLPADAFTIPPLSGEYLTMRQRVENKTSGATCQGCHNVINPLGFVMEDFDSIGRARSVEKIFSPTGALLASLPIDAKVTTSSPTGLSRELTGLSDFQRAMAEGGKGERCMTQKWFEFTRKRNKSEADGCYLQEMLTSLRGEGATPGSIQSMLMRTVSSDLFVKRRMPE